MMALPRISGICGVLWLAGISPALAQSPSACAADAVVCCQLPPAPSPEAKVGIGAQIWPEHVNPSARPQLVQFAPAAVRYSSGPSWQRAGRLPLHASLEEVRQFVAAAFAEKADDYKAQATHFKRYFQSSKAEAHLVIWEPPLTSAEPAQLNVDKDPRILHPEAVEATARFYVAVLEEMNRLDYPVDVVELINEPDGKWNIHAPPEVYVQLLARVRRIAREAGLSLPKIAGPGVSRLSALEKYIHDPQIGTALVNDLDVISVHAWDTRAGASVETDARRLRSRLDALGYTKPIAITEFALNFLNSAADRASLKSKGPDPVSAKDGYGAASLLTILNLAAMRYSPIIYWEFQDTSWGGTAYGLFDVKGSPRPLFTQIDRLRTRVGSLTDYSIRETGPRRGFLAYYRGAQPIALAIVNDTDKAQDVVLNPRISSGSKPEGNFDRCSKDGRETGVRLPPAHTIIVPVH